MRKAYDLLVQAESGLCSVTGTPEAPGRIGISACDVGTGMYAHAAILEALLQRAVTGEGSAIHVSLFDSMADWMTVPLLHYDYANTVWPRVGLGHPTIAPYGAYPVGGAIGEETTILIGVQNDGEWVRFVSQVLRLPELLERAGYQTNILRVENSQQMNSEIKAVLARLSPTVIRERLQAAQVAFASVNGVQELSTHPQLRRTTVATARGTASVVAPPASFGKSPDNTDLCQASGNTASLSARNLPQTDSGRESTPRTGRRRECGNCLHVKVARETADSPGQHSLLHFAAGLAKA